MGDHVITEITTDNSWISTLTHSATDCIHLVGHSGASWQCLSATRKGQIYSGNEDANSGKLQNFHYV
jgi:hypothetical protein